MPVFDDASEMLGQSKGLGQPDHGECREDRTRPVRGVTTLVPSERKLQAVSGDGHPRQPRRATRSAGSLGPKLAEGDMKALIGSAPDIDPNDRAQIARAQFDPDAYLIGGLIRTLLLARRSGPAARLEIGQGAITILPRTGLAMIEPQHFQLRRLAETPLMEPTTQVRLVEEPDLSRVPRRALMPVESLLWNTALLASRGRAPCGLDLDAPLRLKHWPNLTRLSAFPHAARITALLSGAPISLIEAARVLRVPQRFVFALAAAADALELIERPETGADRAQPRRKGQVDTEVQGRRGLLSRLWAQLRK